MKAPFNLTSKIKFAFCLFLFAGTVRSFAQPLTASAGSDVTICNGTSTPIGGSPTASFGSAPYTYSWSPSSTLSAPSASNPNAAPFTTTTYTVTVTDNVANTATATVTITVNALPTVSAPGASICAGGNTTLNASGTAITYSWSPATGLSSTTVANPVAAPATTTSYTVTGTNASGCTSYTTCTVTVNAGPTVNAGSDQTICFGAPVSFAATATGGISYSWTFGDGGTSTVLNPVYNYAAPGVYSATLTSVNSSGCSSSDNVTITVVPTPTVSTNATGATCNGMCNGSITAIAGGSTAPYAYSWTPSGITTATASSLCAAAYTVTVIDANGCTAVSSATVTQPAPFNVNAGAAQTICMGDATTLIAVPIGGNAPYTYNWNDGSGNFPGPTFTVGPIVATAYTLTATDNTGCIATGNTSVSIAPNTDIWGHVTYSGGSLNSGSNSALLYGYNLVTGIYDSIMASTLDANGFYHFASVPHNNYIIKVMNDTAAYPLMIPTYFGNQYLWDSAAVGAHDCFATDTANITMIEVPAMSGPGHVEGSILQGAGFSRMPGDPIPGVDIKLGRNPGGQLVASTQTGTGANEGQYSFDNIPVNLAGENYVIYVDIPGYGRDSSYTFTVDATHTDFDEYDYVVDSSTVYIVQTTTGITPVSAKATTFSVYPNPANENLTISYTTAKEQAVSLTIYNVLGVKEAELVNNRKQSEGAYTYSVNPKNYNLSPGVSLITLVMDGKASTQRLVITE